MTTAANASDVRFRRAQAPDKTHLGHIGGFHIGGMGDVWLEHQIVSVGWRVCGAPTAHFRPERSKARFFQHLPPAQELLEIVPFSPDVDLEQQLAKRQRLVLVLVRLDERFEHAELGAFDIDLEDVDEFVACGPDIEYT